MAYLMTFKRKRQARLAALAAASAHGNSSGVTEDGLIYGLRFGKTSTVLVCDHANAGAVLCPTCAAAAGLADTANPSEPVVAATRTPQPTQGANRTMAQRLVIRPVPDSITEGRKLRAAKEAGTYNPAEELPSVVAHRAAMQQADSTARKVAKLEAAAAMKNYVIPDSLAEGRKLADARNDTIRKWNTK